MKQQETAKFLAVVKTAYPHFEITDAVARLWHEMLLNIDFHIAQTSLHEHIRTNRFPPAISDIVQQHEESDIDPEIRARNIEIAHSQWVRDGNDPEAFVYEPDGDGPKRLRN